jgi:4-methyl-5(b-hydroxyethyl)-thiazole monophosphate biosynthesis
MKRVILFLAQGLEEYEASVFTDALGWTRTYGLEPIEVDTVGLREKVICCWNFTIVPEYQLSEINPDDYDALAIPGGFGDKGFYEDTYDERFLSLIRDFDTKGKLIASVCVAALPVAKSGVLSGRNGTTYHLGGKRRAQLAEMGVNVLDQHLVVDKNIITSTSPSAAMDVAFELLKMLTSEANLEKVKEGMGFIRK